MKEYPSRSNLNCLIVVLRGLGRRGDEFRFHSGLSTSVEWGKPLSIFLIFQRTYFLICFTKICRFFHSAKHFVKSFLFFFGLVVYLLSACKWEDYCMIRQLTSKPFCFTKICRLFQSAKHFVKYFFVVRVGLEPTTIWTAA